MTSRVAEQIGGRTTFVYEDAGVTLATQIMLAEHPDYRGSVRESFRESWFGPAKQIVHSESKPGVLRGMHFHRRQTDYWHLTRGDALVQLYEPKSSAYADLLLSPSSTLAIPPGVAHGFYTAEGCTLVYALTEEYDAASPDEYGFNPFSPSYPGSLKWHGAGPSTALMSKRDIDAPDLDAFMAKPRGN